MSLTLAFPEDLWDELVTALDLAAESAAVVTVRPVVGEDLQSLLVRQLIWVPDEHYVQRESSALDIESGGYIAALRVATEDNAIAMFVHTHPDNAPRPSDRDDGVDADLAEPFRIRTRQELYGSFILGGTRSAPTFTGRVYGESHDPRPIDRVRVVGRRLRILDAWAEGMTDGQPDLFDRQVRAFGVEGQQRLASMTAAVVGLGGTGSAVFEQLVRLGIGSLIAIDDDVISDTNVTRVYGSTIDDVGKAKVRVAAAQAARIGLGTSVETCVGRVTDQTTARKLRDCDVIFGCTDDHAGRAVLSRLTYWYLIPLIDVGVMISADHGVVHGVDVRITSVFPGAPCLLCRRRIDPQRAREELLETAERDRLAAEGYAQGLGEPDPSVVSYTSLGASFAVSEMLERLVGYGDEEAATELLVRLHDRKLSSITGTCTPEHYCADRDTWGRGDVVPFLGQVWAN